MRKRRESPKARRRRSLMRKVRSWNDGHRWPRIFPIIITENRSRWGRVLLERPTSETRVEEGIEKDATLDANFFLKKPDVLRIVFWNEVCVDPRTNIRNLHETDKPESSPWQKSRSISACPRPRSTLKA
jgi:hypothetical protein